MVLRSSPRSLLPLAAVAAALALVAPARPAHAVENAERQGGRFGVSLLGGFALGAGPGFTSPTGLVGPVLRFGGAVTDRFHILGEFTLLALPGGAISGVPGMGFHAAVGLAGQGYIGPRLFVRTGLGVGWATAVTGSSWFLPLPGPRIALAAGYDLYRRDELSISVALEGSYTFLFNAGSGSDRLFTLAASIGVDWY